MTTTWLILARAVHFGACLLFFGVFVFDRFVATTISTDDKNSIDADWRSLVRLFNFILLPLILLSGILWFMLVAMTMSDGPLQAEILRTVWTQTQFGTVWKLRFGLLLVSAVITLLLYFAKSPPRLFKNLVWLQLLFSGALLGSLAWAGHALEGSSWHLFADTLHLLVAGFWPSGLLPLFLLLKKLRHPPSLSPDNSIAALVRRFSAISLASVALLTLTGFINSWFLVGSWSNLFHESYGHWLLLKIILFCLLIMIGAVNLLRLKPRLGHDNSPPQTTALAQLQCNVRAELFFSLIVILVVAVLGILPPASH